LKSQDPPPFCSSLSSLHQTQPTLPHRALSPTLARHSFSPTTSPSRLRQSGNTMILEPRLDSPRRLPPSKPTSTHLLPPINTSTALSPQSTFHSPLSPRPTVQSKSSVDGMTQRDRKRLRNGIDENSSASENEEGRKRRKSQKSRGNATGEELQRSVGASSAVESNSAPRSGLESIGGRMKRRRDKEKLNVYVEANEPEKDTTEETESDLEEGEIREVSNKVNISSTPNVDLALTAVDRFPEANHLSIDLTSCSYLLRRLLLPRISSQVPSVSTKQHRLSSSASSISFHIATYTTSRSAHEARAQAEYKSSTIRSRSSHRKFGTSLYLITVYRASFSSICGTKTRSISHHFRFETTSEISSSQHL